MACWGGDGRVRRGGGGVHPATLEYEKEDYFGYRWWPVPEVLNSSERFYPGKLPALLATFLDGQEIDEPFELWS